MMIMHYLSRSDRLIDMLLSVHRNIQDDAERYVVDQHRSSAETDKRQRNTRDRQQSDRHSEILYKMESERRAKSGNRVRLRRQFGAARDIHASGKEKECQHHDCRCTDKTQMFRHCRIYKVTLFDGHGSKHAGVIA